MYLPKPVYEFLPYLYLACGILSVFGFEPTSGRFGGILLVAAASGIFALRTTNRSRK